MYIFNSFYLVHIIQVFSFVRVLTLPLSDAVSPPPPPTLEFYWNRTVVLSQSLGYLWTYPGLIHYIL